MQAVPFAVSAKSRLTHHDLGRFPSDTLFNRLARAVCAAAVLPRKELYEAWEVAPVLDGCVAVDAWSTWPAGTACWPT